MSGIFAGNSPGWAVRDARFAASVNPTDAVSTAMPTAEPAFTIANGTSVDRIIVPGGAISGDTTVLNGNATATAAGSVLTVQLLYTPWSSDVNVGSNFTRPGWVDEGLVASGTATMGTTSTDFVMTLSFSSAVLGPLVTTGLQTSPGDIFTLRFSSSGGDITLNTQAVDAAGNARTHADFTSTQVRQTVFAYRSIGGYGFLNEHLAGTVTSSTSTRPIGTTPYAIIDELPSERTLGVNSTSSFQVAVIDASFAVVPNSPVTFTAIGSASGTVTTRTDASGLATAVFSWAVAGSFTVTASIPTGTVTVTSPWTITVITQPTRDFDDLLYFDARTLPPLVSVNMPSLLIGPPSVAGSNPALAGTAGTILTSLPTDVIYRFAQSTTGNATWSYNLQLRTSSLLTSATAQARIQVWDPTSTTLVAQAGPFSVTSALQPFAGTMTQMTTNGIDAVGQLNRYVSPDAFVVAVISSGSSDAQSPGVEVVTDPRAGGSTISVPGPVVLADFDAGSAPRATPRRILVSQPDPRR